MECLDHSLHLAYTDLPVKRIGRIGAFRNVVIDRIIAPVILICRGVGFVNTSKVIGWHDLHMRNPKPLQIIQTGRQPLRTLRSLLRKS